MANFYINSVLDFLNIASLASSTDDIFLNVDLDFGNTNVDISSFDMHSTFNGQGHKISNIYNTSSIQIFGRINHFRNTIFENITFDFPGQHRFFGVPYTNLAEFTDNEFYNITFNQSTGQYPALFQGNLPFKTQRIRIDNYNITNKAFDLTGYCGILTTAKSNIGPNLIEQLEATNLNIYGYRGVGLVASYTVSSLASNESFFIRNCKLEYNDLLQVDNTAIQGNIGGLVGQLDPNATSNMKFYNNIVIINTLRNDQIKAGALVGNLDSNNASRLEAYNNVVYVNRFISKKNDNDRGAQLVDLSNYIAQVPNLHDNMYYSGTELYYEAPGGTQIPFNFIRQDADELYSDLAILKQQSTYTAKSFDFVNIWAIQEGLTYPYLQQFYVPPVGQTSSFVKVDGVWRDVISTKIKVDGIWRDVVDVTIKL